MSETVKNAKGFNIGGVRLSKEATTGRWFKTNVRGAGELWLKIRFWDKLIQRKLAEVTKGFEKLHADELEGRPPSEHHELSDVFNVVINTFFAESIVLDAKLADQDYTPELGAELMEVPEVNTFVTRTARARHEFTQLAVSEGN